MNFFYKQQYVYIERMKLLNINILYISIRSCCLTTATTIVITGASGDRSRRGFGVDELELAGLRIHLHLEALRAQLVVLDADLLGLQRLDEGLVAAVRLAGVAHTQQRPLAGDRVLEVGTAVGQHRSEGTRRLQGVLNTHTL